MKTKTLRTRVNKVPKQLTPFKPGHKKMGGRTKDPLAVKALKTYTKETIAELFKELMEAPRNSLLSIALAPNSTGIRAALARAIYAEDFSTIDKILDRCIGKVPQRMEGADGKPLIPATPPAVIYVGVKPNDK